MSHRTAIIHIGTPKTGTTSIQQVLKRQRHALVQQGVSFPTSPGTTPTHGMLSAACMGAPYRPADRVWGGMEPAATLAQFNRELEAELKHLPGGIKQVIFADENLCVVLRTQKQIECLRALLQPFFGQFIIVVYLRRQDQLVASQYTHMLRQGMVHLPDATFDISGNYHYYDYNTMLGNWADIFGKDAIKPRIYEHSTQGPFDSVADFNALCALTLPQGERKLPRTPSISIAGQTILREVGAILLQKTGRETAGGAAWRAICAAVTNTLPGRGWSPSPAESSAFLQRFEAGNEAVRQLYCPDRPTLFSNEFSKQEDPSQDLSDRALFTATCQTLVESMTVRINRNQALARKARQQAADAPPEAQPAEEDDEDVDQNI